MRSAGVFTCNFMLGFEVSCTKYCYRLAKFRNKNSVSNFNFRLNRFPFLTTDSLQLPNTLSRDWRNKNVSLSMLSIITHNLTVYVDCQRGRAV